MLTWVQWVVTCELNNTLMLASSDMLKNLPQPWWAGFPMSLAKSEFPSIPLRLILEALVRGSQGIV